MHRIGFTPSRLAGGDEAKSSAKQVGETEVEPTWEFEIFPSEKGDTAIVECHADPPRQYAFNLCQGERVLRKDLLTSADYGFARIKVHKSKLDFDREDDLNAQIIQAEEVEPDTTDEEKPPVSTGSKKADKAEKKQSKDTKSAHKPREENKKEAEKHTFAPDKVGMDHAFDKERNDLARVFIQLLDGKRRSFQSKEKIRIWDSSEKKGYCLRTTRANGGYTYTIVRAPEENKRQVGVEVLSTGARYTHTVDWTIRL